MPKNKNIIIGGGVTGLAAGVVSNLKVYEAQEVPGGICSSYYLRAGSDKQEYVSPEDEEAYRFEIGGGHWIFGGDSRIINFIKSLTPVKEYSRKSSVYFPDLELFIPYPIQNHLSYLGKEIADKAIYEIKNTTDAIPVTMEDWLEKSFGKTLLEKFFAPFHELYTAGLWTIIAPQDAYKSPVDIEAVKKGAFGQNADAAGYNIKYLYPIEGLNILAGRMSHRCNIEYRKKVTEINLNNNEIIFSDGSGDKYEKLLSTLPLNKALKFSNLSVDEEQDDYTSVLVLNIGATKGTKCPDDHWIYIPNSKSKFHRIGFYSNVDSSFLPKISRKDMDRVSIYVEKAYPNGHKPSEDEINSYSTSVVEELKEWKFIMEAETVHPTWIEVAYTWTKPGSKWQTKSLELLEENNVIQVGRYGRWKFQGIAESMNDGFNIGKIYK